MNSEKWNMRRLAAALCTVLLLAAVYAVISSEEAEAATTYSYTRVYISGGGDITSQFHIAGMTGLCQNGSKDSPSSGKATLKKLSNDDLRTKLCYTYGYRKKWTSGEEGCRLARALYFTWSKKYYHQSKSVIDSMVATAKKVSVPEWFSAYSCYPTNDLQEFVAWKYTPPGKLYILKSSSDARSLKTGKYSFKGIKYGVYSDKSCSTKKADLVCDAEGKTDTVSLAPGTYYIRELSAAGNYTLKTTVYSAKVTSEKTVKKELSDNPVTGKTVLKKSFSDDSDSGYSDEKGYREHFRFRFTNTKDKSISYSGETDENGVLRISGMLLGKYRVTEELTESQLVHYEDISKAQTVEVKAGETAVTVSWENRYRKRQALKIFKKTGDGEPAGGFTFEVSGVTKRGVEIGPLEVTTSEDEADNAVITMNDIEPGVYTVTEKLTESQQKQYFQPEAQTMEIDGDEEAAFVFSFENIPKWTPVKLKKASRDGCIEGIDFRITGTTDFGKEVDISGKTDNEGYIDFGNLYAGTYLLEEISFDPSMYENNYTVDGMEGRQCIRFTVTGKESGTLWLGGSEGSGGEGTEFVNRPFAKLLVTKTDAETGQFLPGAEFELMDEKGKQVIRFSIDEEESEEGEFVVKPVVYECIEGVSAISFSELSEDDQENTGEETGDNELRYIAIQGLREGASYTLYEREAPLGYSVSEPVSIGKLEDLFEVVVEDRKPSIFTSAHDEESGGNVSLADDDVTITDTVTYSGVTPGETYVISGMLMDKTGITEENAEDISAVTTDEGEVTSKVEFTPKASEGTVDVTFSFDGSGLSGKETVVYESMSKDDEEVATHMERDSSLQSIAFREPSEIPETGEGFPWPLIAAGAGAAALAYAAVNRKRFFR